MMIDTVQQNSIARSLQIASVDIMRNLGKGRADGTAYDTAWTARLAVKYENPQFIESIQWLLRNQHEDGTWGALSQHYHDRYISTLAAIVTLASAERTHLKRIDRRIENGIKALWRIVGKLHHDDHDTIGFPILSIFLTEEALTLGLDVPQPSVRYAEQFKNKVKMLLSQKQRDWIHSTLVFSLEALINEINEDDNVFDKNGSVGLSSSATAGYLLRFEHPQVHQFLINAINEESTGASPPLKPIDLFEIAWSINHLRYAGLITPSTPGVMQALDILYEAWSPQVGLGFSSQSRAFDVDDTMASFAVLRWAGYDVSPDVLSFYEESDHFKCFAIETDPSMSANIRVLLALREISDDYPHKQRWINKVLTALRNHDGNGSYWTDKWHASPYYVNTAALVALEGLDDTLVQSRLKWILNTQNDDGGWGYYQQSTAEETAYCLESLLWWDKHVNSIDDTVLDSAANYLSNHIHDTHYTPLWIGKSLYTPYYPVKSVIIGSLYSYLERNK